MAEPHSDEKLPYRLPLDTAVCVDCGWTETLPSRQRTLLLASEHATATGHMVWVDNWKNTSYPPFRDRSHSTVFNWRANQERPTPVVGSDDGN